MKKRKPKIALGWREWVSLPDLGIEKIKAKVDTGARTSTLHAFEVKERVVDNRKLVDFKIHPSQDNTDEVVSCSAEVFDKRDVTDSGGHKENRLVIKTTLAIGDESRLVEITLTDRDTMKFRMLIGRTALKPVFVVDPGKSYLAHPDIKE
jgi:hypothetical protein